MCVLDVVGSYYEAWMTGKGDFSAVPLAEDFEFTGPMASFDTAEGFRQMAAQAGPMVTRFTVRASSSTVTRCARSSTGR